MHIVWVCDNKNHQDTSLLARDSHTWTSSFIRAETLPYIMYSLRYISPNSDEKLRCTPASCACFHDVRMVLHGSAFNCIDFLSPPYANLAPFRRPVSTFNPWLTPFRVFYNSLRNLIPCILTTCGNFMSGSKRT